MFKKRGQAAMEFLMTYGWAILVVLVAIGALAYFGVLNPDRFLPEKCVISTGSGMFCEDHTADTTGITIRVKNILAESVTVTDVSTDTPACAWTGTQAIAADGTFDFALAGCTPASGDKIKADITIAYSKGAAGLARTTTGSIVTTVP